MHFYTCSNYLISKCTMHVVHWLTDSYLFYLLLRKLHTDWPNQNVILRTDLKHLDYFVMRVHTKKVHSLFFCKVVLHTVIQERCFALPPIDMVTLSDFPFTSSHHVYSVSTFIITYIILNLYFCNNKFTVNRFISSMKQLLLLHKS